MDFVFDIAQDLSNRAKHVLALKFGEEVIRNAVTTLQDRRVNYAEDRFVSFGYVEERLYVCVYVVRENTLRLISVRKANNRETCQYG